MGAVLRTSDFIPIYCHMTMPRKLSRLVKRAIDLVGSLLALTVLSPLLVAIAVVIKLTSKGPILFKQYARGTVRCSVLVPEIQIDVFPE